MSNELAVLDAFREGTPMQRLLGDVLEEVGGISFVADWAEENPGDFMRILVAAFPSLPPTAGATTDHGTHIHVHPALAVGPLDVEGSVVAEG